MDALAVLVPPKVTTFTLTKLWGRSAFRNWDKRLGQAQSRRAKRLVSSTGFWLHRTIIVNPSQIGTYVKLRLRGSGVLGLPCCFYPCGDASLLSRHGNWISHRAILWWESQSPWRLNNDYYDSLRWQLRLFKRGSNDGININKRFSKWDCHGISTKRWNANGNAHFNSVKVQLQSTDAKYKNM